MEAIVQQAIITSISGLILFSLGILASTLTGKSKAEVRGIQAQASKDDSGAAKDYADLARQVAKDNKELREEIFGLTARVETLEREKIEWQKERDDLRQELGEVRSENEKLKASINTKGLARK